MKIALDAMGGDFAPEEVVKGAVLAAKEFGIEQVLVGKEQVIRDLLVKYDGSKLPLSVVHAEEIVEMHEQPTSAIRTKRNSSIVQGLNLVKQEQAAAFVSAGNSGAVMAASSLILGRIKGIERPAIAATFITLKGFSLLLDVGANADCKPQYLVQFALMGSLYLEKVLGVPSPAVALLSNGEEESKGNHLVREAHQLLKKTNLNFIGNIEGKDVPLGAADVIVTDGFVGNVALKLGEGMGDSFYRLVRGELSKNLLFKLVALILLPAFRRIKKRLDYVEYAGAPLLGVDGVCIIAHGRSNATAIKNALRVAQQAAKQNVAQSIKLGIQEAMSSSLLEPLGFAGETTSEPI